MVVRPSKGGAFGHVARLSQALVDGGHEVAVCGPHGAHRADLRAEVIEIDMGREVAPGSDLAAVREVARTYRSFRPDLIHAHGSKGATFARLARYARPRTPLIFTPHNFAFTNYFAGGAQRSVYRAIETTLAPLATRVICVCEAEREAAARVGLTRRTRVVYNGIEPFDHVIPSERAQELAARGPLVAAVTEFQPPKGVPTLIEAMPRLLEHQPDANLAIAGEGFMRGELEARIAELGIGERVHLLGQLADVTGLLDAADVFVSPSWSESFPYAVLEPMSFALPVVATEVGGVGEMIEDGVSGWLVESHDPAARAARVGDALGDRELALRMGDAARERVLGRFTFAHTLAGVLGVYAEVGVS